MPTDPWEMPTSWEMPAFPLGSVLLPGQLMALQVFDPRYRVMLFDLREADPIEFLVTLIVRGSEVGGGDVRSDVGCVARVTAMADQPDGRVLLEVVGDRPLAVLEWLTEDPYPVARVADVPSANTAVEATAEPSDELRRALELDEELAGSMRRLGLSVPQRPAPAGALEEMIWQLALRSPIGTLDRQRLLEAADVDTRLSLLVATMQEQSELLSARLAMEGD